MTSMMATQQLSAADAERIGKRPDALKEDSPPMLRFEEGMQEDRTASIKAGKVVYLPIIKVFMHAIGDTKCEVPDVVKGWTVEQRLVDKEVKRRVYRDVEQADGTVKREEREITETVQEPFFFNIPTTPWFDKLDEKLHHGHISANYYDSCKAAFARWEQNQEDPVQGTPIKGWNQISMAMQENMISLGINSIELAAEMNEDSMDALGMGARDAQKKARAFLTTTDQGQSVAKMVALENENERMRDQLSAVEQKMAQLAEMQEAAPKKRGRPKKEVFDGASGDDTEGN